MTTYSIGAHTPGRLARVGHILLHEFNDIWPPTLFFFIGFNLILFTKRLILSAYLIQFTGFAVATVSALIATQMWIFVLFLVYVTSSEINQLLGDGELFKIFFTRRSSELKSTRRARIRQLIQLARLTEAHPISVLRDPSSSPHAELVRILLSLSQKGETARPLATTG